MSTPGRPLDYATREGIRRLMRDGHSRRKIAREMDVCKRTVDKYAHELDLEIDKTDENSQNI